MTAEENASWDYKPDGQTKGQTPDLGSRNSSAEPRPKKRLLAEIEWTASEYIDHSRGTGWYTVLIFGTAMLAAVVYFLTKDIFAAVITVVVGIVVGIFSMNKPKEITYKLSSDGFSAGDKQYSFSQFKSFAIIREGDLYSLNLVPVKKFMPLISAYFAAHDEEKIVNMLGQYLAYEERGLDSIERLTRRLRF
ncbi:TPA: hypothetical protein DIS56_04015 [Candidatus Saccharibacteria bacterium]|nr:MAG: hypothetical protein UX30_C0003G0036 [Candidatus Saccharibacteria bacterium GW2011_GWA2_46_10]OGL36363.1 MAG: hypothetical protein A3F05_01270 [Candidatus Saccharibacteria bacterium RIFCSPHIGHO2_12_FULL_47_17]HCM52261.1 hypothetical protein [Candidatus Saccharibacteria bacterium]